MTRLFFAPRGRRPLERLARGLLLAGVFALVVVAYRRHFDAVIEQTAARGVVADPAGILTREDRAWVLARADRLQARLGLSLRLRLGGEPPEGVGPRTVLFYYDPDCRQSRVLTPPLVAAALPPGLPDDLGRDHLDAACQNGQAREGVLGALGLFVESLDDAARRGKGVTHD